MDKIEEVKAILERHQTTYKGVDIIPTSPSTITAMALEICQLLLSYQDVIEILDEPVTCEDGKSHFIDESVKRNLAHQICQLEPKPQVYCLGENTGCDHEDKPNLKECSDCPYMTTTNPDESPMYLGSDGQWKVKPDDILTEQDIIPVPETEKEREALGWHKIDESRLMTDEEITEATGRFSSWDLDGLLKVRDAQDAKTASLKDIECQTRVERIFKQTLKNRRK